MDSQQELNEAEDMIFSLRKQIMSLKDECNQILDDAIANINLKAAKINNLSQQLDAAIIEIAQWKNSYENMKDFAVKSGLDITCYGTELVDDSIICDYIA